ncbi:MAG: hypothetical protein M1816_003189 [Peltula sp. TS41687]|nr:MAG: hypothetical protein M1816_003189 [Peltula sp. TS41687]
MARTRSKKKSTGQHPSTIPQKRGADQETHDLDPLYAIKDIIGENNTQYLIDWENNRVTGEAYAPTWEPKANANRAAVDAWERVKRERDFEPNARRAIAQGTSGSQRPQHSNPVNIHDTLNTHAEVLSREPEIPDSLESHETPPQRPSVIVQVQPSDVVVKAEYSEFPGSSSLESIVNPNTSARFPIGTVIPDSQPGPSSLTQATLLSSQHERIQQVPKTSLANTGSGHHSNSIIDTINSVSGFLTTTGGQNSNEGVQNVHNSSSKKGVTENSAGNINSTNQTDSWLTASYPVSTAPLAVPEEHVRTGERSVLSSVSVHQSIESDSGTIPPHSQEHQTVPSVSPTEYRSVMSSIPQDVGGDAEMSDAPSLASNTSQPATTFKEKLTALRASGAATRAARMSQSGPSSAIPDHRGTSASGPINNTGSGPFLQSAVSQPTTQVESEQFVMPAGLSQGGSSITLQKPSLGQSEYIVALPMAPALQNSYKQYIFNNRAAIESFTNAETPDQVVKDQITKLMLMVERAENLLIHADLAKSASPEPTTTSIEARMNWGKYASAKFDFLGHFLVAVNRCNAHIAILVQGAQLLGLLERFLKEIKVRYYRVDNHVGSHEGTGRMATITLIPTGAEGARYIVRRANAVIVVDGSFDPKAAHVRSFRTDYSDANLLTPVLHLVIANSAEHVGYCLPKEIEDPVLRQKLLLGFMAQARNEAGKLPAGYPSPSEAATQVAHYILKNRRAYEKDDLVKHGEEMNDGKPAEWPLPSLGEVAGLSTLVAPQVSGGSVGAPSQAHEGPMEVDVEGQVDAGSAGPQAQKRGLGTVVEEDTESSKKQRVAPAEGSLPSSNMESEAADPSNLEHPGHEGAEAEAGLREAISSLTEELGDYQELLQQTQDQSKPLTKEVRALKKERDEKAAALKQAEGRSQAQETKITTLQGDLGRLGAQVSQMREMMTGSQVPERAEWVRLQTAKETAEAEVARLVSKLRLTEEDFEFTRAQYQAASTAAVEARAEVEGLRRRNEELERVSGEERAGLVALLENREREEDVKDREIRRLKTKVEVLEDILRTKTGVVEID